MFHSGEIETTAILSLAREERMIFRTHLFMQEHVSSAIGRAYYVLAVRRSGVVTDVGSFCVWYDIFVGTVVVSVWVVGSTVGGIPGIKRGTVER